MEILTVGDYRTRGGHAVTVESLDGKGTFKIKGCVWMSFKGKSAPLDITWQSNGRHRVVGESALDIVGVWSA